jgi:hypothetical protein
LFAVSSPASLEAPTVTVLRTASQSSASDVLLTVMTRTLSAP